MFFKCWCALTNCSVVTLITLSLLCAFSNTISLNVNSAAVSQPTLLNSVTPSESISVQQPRPDLSRDISEASLDRSGRATRMPDYPLNLVHLDLKGAPPKVSYYEEFFPFVRRMGATGLLIEYEDMFPFWGPLSAIRAKNAYNRSDIERILTLAKQSQLEVIPLVQTFGHLEFVLKLSEFQDLRETSLFPQAICPSKNASMQLLHHIIDQVMALHVGVHWLHIGCDEVFQLGTCQDCQNRIYTEQQRRGHYAGKHFLFLDHVRTVASYVKQKHHVQPIIWDDMLRTVSESELVSQLGNGLVEPMVWVYVPQIYRFVDPGVWRKYSRAFPSVWAAGAFKGAFGPTMFAVNSYRHLECTVEWLDVMRTQGVYFKNGFRGYVLTGWQRYDHFATLCELLPAGIPSLAANLVLVNHTRMDDALMQKLTTTLTCSPRFRQPTIRSMAKNPFLWEYSRCSFPGRPFFRLLRSFKQLRSKVRRHVRTVTEEQAWLANYNVRHNFSSPQRIMEAISWHNELLQSTERLRDDLKIALGHVFDNHTVSEWLEQNMRPMLDSLQKLDADAHALMVRETWPARPLPSDYGS